MSTSFHHLKEELNSVLYMLEDNEINIAGDHAINLFKELSNNGKLFSSEDVRNFMECAKQKPTISDIAFLYRAEDYTSKPFNGKTVTTPGCEVLFVFSAGGHEGNYLYGHNAFWKEVIGYIYGDLSAQFSCILTPFYPIFKPNPTPEELTRMNTCITHILIAMNSMSLLKR